MNRPRTALGILARKPAFCLWGWAMLAVVLLCSAPTGGPPRTRIVGSAFDPATTLVVVKPSQMRLGQKAAKLKQGDTPADRLALFALADESSVPAVLVPADFNPSADLDSNRLDKSSALRRLTRPLGTRAPPNA